jgi:DNA-binding SARP family transcriptional activator
VRFSVLGPVQVERAGDTSAPSGAKERAILARLLLEPGAAVPADALLEAVWQDAPKAAASRTLSVRMARLRGFLEPDRPAGQASRLLLRDAGGYRLAVAPEDVDAVRFEQAVQAAAGLPPEEALAVLDDALALWRGSPYPELEDSGVATAQVRRLDERRRHALEARAGALTALDRHDEAVLALEQLIEAEPMREEVVRALMLALYRSGRQLDALEAYRALAGRLVEVGLRPVQETRELERRILDQDPALRGGAQERPAAAPVGRARELDVLRAALGAAIAGWRRTVAISGDAGTGKTVLLDAFLAEADATEARVARGQGVEHRGPGEPYLPLLDAIASLAADPATRALLVRHAPTWLLQLPWLVDDAEAPALERRVRGATRERMLRELLTLVEALAAQRPLVIAIDDAQWADAPTIDALAALARRHTPARVLLIVAFRGGIPGATAPAVQALVAELGLRGQADELALRPLSDAALQELVAARFPAGAPPEVCAALARRSAGLPLFACVLLDHWQATGALRVTDGAAELTVAPAALEAGVPQTLRGHLEHELATLAADDRELLSAAALVGRRVDPATVAATLDRPPDAVRERCLALTQATSLLRADEGTFAFGADLEREVLRDALPDARRRALHARLGAHLERVYGAAAADHAAELAHHYVAGGDAANAVRFLRAAAGRAFARSAAPEGLRHLQGALEAARTLPEGTGRMRLEADLLAQIGQASVAVEGWSSPLAESSLQEARALAERLDDNEPLVAVLLALATLCEVRGEVERAHALTDECLSRAPVLDRGSRLEAEELLACSLFHQGAFARALEHAEAGLDLFAASGPDGGHYSTFPATMGDNAGVACQDWAGLALWFLGEPDRALKRAHLAHVMAGDPERAYAIATAAAQLAVVHGCRREPREALRWAQDTIRCAEELGYAYRAAMGRVLAGWSIALLDEPARGAYEIVAGLEASRRTGAGMDDPFYLALLAEARLRGGEPGAAEAAIDEALVLARASGSRHYEPELLRLRAAANADDPGPAEADLRAAVEIADAQGSRMLALRAATDLAVLLGSGRAAGAARAALAARLATFTEGRHTVDLRAAAQAAGAAVGAR